MVQRESQRFRLGITAMLKLRWMKGYSLMWLGECSLPTRTFKKPPQNLQGNDPLSSRKWPTFFKEIFCKKRLTFAHICSHLLTLPLGDVVSLHREKEIRLRYRFSNIIWLSHSINHLKLFTRYDLLQVS
jgi:hypothetical protein